MSSEKLTVTVKISKNSNIRNETRRFRRDVSIL